MRKKQDKEEDSSSFLFNGFMEQFKEVAEKNYEQKLQQLNDNFAAATKESLPLVQAVGVYSDASVFQSKSLLS